MKVIWTDEVRGHYIGKYPDDELGGCIKAGVTFEDVFVSLQLECCVYELLDVWDSIVREMVFEALARVMGCSYNYIYNKWLDGAERCAYVAEEREEIFMRDYIA